MLLTAVDGVISISTSLLLMLFFMHPAFGDDLVANCLSVALIGLALVSLCHYWLSSQRWPCIVLEITFGGLGFFGIALSTAMAVAVHLPCMLLGG